MWRVKPKIMALPRPDGSAWDSMKAYFKEIYMMSYFAKQFTKTDSALRMELKPEKTSH
jgi:hypothetical protein